MKYPLFGSSSLDATNTRGTETIFAYCCQFFERESTELYIYIYVCEFNFVSRNIGKVGKIGLLKNDLWFWNKNILQEWNLKIVKLINLDLCQFFERWMKYILNLVFILGWENWFAIYLWKNVLKYKYFRY